MNHIPADSKEIRFLLNEADQEVGGVDLDDYSEVIDKLREKGFSWRRIADWLNERNVRVSHNQLYYYAIKREREPEHQEPSILDELD